MPAPLPFAVLVSGRGSNMLAIAAAARDGQIPGGPVAVVSDRADAAGLAAAAALGIPTEVVAPAQFADRGDWCRALSAAIASHGAEFVALAGFMRILDPGFVARWQGRLLNIHPSLLPAYPGLHTHRRVLEAGDRWHGCTVHFVTEELDAGPLVIQGRVPVLSGDTEQALSARVQKLEHIIYPKAVGWLAAGRLALDGGTVLLDGQPLRAPLIEEPE